MKKINLFFILITAIVSSCNHKQSTTDPLPVWNETPIKQKILDFMQKDVPNIPVEDRLAVFDMDGTIACEEPLWLEMYCAVQGLCMQVDKDSSLIQQTMYKYAEKLKENPKDTSVQNHWGSYIDTMVHSAFKGWDNEKYIDYCKEYLSKAKNIDYNITLDSTFYQPMLELLTYLKENSFDVYIVSGSLQGLMWSVCPQRIGFDRVHLIGTRQQMSPIYIPAKQAEFILQPLIYQPKNNGDGKALNIYSYIGKTPVFAFGNTTGDWGMFHLTSTNTLPNISFMLNHDDAEREYKYLPWHGKGCPAWEDSMRVNGWNTVSMKECFKEVFMK